MGRTYIGYGYTNAEGVATLDYDANGNQLPKKSYACHSRNTSVVAEASIDNVITASNSIRFCENYVPPSETLSLTADKSVLSYADSDSCTLTATYDGSDVSGKSVVFKVGSTVLATETTDSNGVATYEYESQGVGDVTITAECMNLQETYDIQDCLIYRTDVTDSANLTTILPSKFSIEVSLTRLTASSNYGYLRISDSNNTFVYDIGSLRGNGSITIRKWKPSETLIADKNSEVIPINTETELKYIYNNGSHSLTVNNQTVTATDSTEFYKLDTMAVKSYNVKNLKLKPL